MGDVGQVGALPVARPVTVRAQPGLRLLATLVLGALLVGLLGTVVLAVREGDAGAPFGRQGWDAGVAAGWLLVGVLLVGLSLALTVLLTMRTRLTTTEAESRLGFHRGRVSVHEASHISYAGPTHRGTTGPAAARLTVHGPGGAPVATFSGRETEWPLVLANLREWVRARPSLVRDEETAEVFTALEAP